jgi:hypothetical protein
MVQCLTVVVSLYLFSHAYNVLLVLTYPGPNGATPGATPYTINSKMGISYSNLMKVSQYLGISNRKMLFHIVHRIV